MNRQIKYQLKYKTLHSYSLYLLYTSDKEKDPNRQTPFPKKKKKKEKRNSIQLKFYPQSSNSSRMHHSMDSRLQALFALICSFLHATGNFFMFCVSNGRRKESQKIHLFACYFHCWALGYSFQL